MRVKFHTYLILSIIIILQNCNNPSSISQKIKDQRPENEFSFIDISEAVNIGFRDMEIISPNGETKVIPALDLYHKIPSGIQVFDDGLIAFNIENPDIKPSIAILLNKSQESGEELSKSKKIKVDHQYSELYFLHTVMGISESKDPVSLVNYRIFFEDSTELIIECFQGDQVYNCWETPRRLNSGIRTYHEGHFWLVNTPWKNPYPEKMISFIQIESTGEATSLLFAITGSNEPDTYSALTDIINERIQKHRDSDLRIALIQPFAEPDMEVNIEKGEKFCRHAKAMNADMAVFPEMYSVGYASIDFDKPNALEECEKVAQKRNGPFVVHFKKLARELDMAILITYLEKKKGKYLNSATLIDRHGESIMTYSKVHTLDFFKMEASFEPGEGFEVVELDTRFGPVQTGIMICYDREFPESARVLMLKGAELILTPNACGLDPLRINQFQTRAWENAVVCAMSNYAEGEWYNGRSCAFNANGDEILMAGEREGVFIAEINLVEVQEIREDTYWGNAFRRPHKYHNLISDEVLRPFKRENVFGQPFIREDR